MDDGRLRSVCAIAIEGTVSACICMGVGAEGGGGLPKETKFLPLKSDSITWSHSDIISNVLNIPNIRLDIRLPRFPGSETFLPKIPLMKSRQRWISLGVVYAALITRSAAAAGRPDIIS